MWSTEGNGFLSSTGKAGGELPDGVKSIRVRVAVESQSPRLVAWPSAWRVCMKRASSAEAEKPGLVLDNWFDNIAESLDCAGRDSPYGDRILGSAPGLNSGFVVSSVIGCCMSPPDPVGWIPRPVIPSWCT